MSFGLRNRTDNVKNGMRNALVRYKLDDQVAGYTVKSRGHSAEYQLCVRHTRRALKQALRREPLVD